MTSRLTEIETAMRALDPTRDEYWALKPERDTLRAQADVRFLDDHHYGTRSGCHTLLPWPEDTRGRFRSLRAFIETHHDVRLGDNVPSSYTGERLAVLEGKLGAAGEAVRQWVAMIDKMVADNTYVMRDAISLKLVSQRYASLMVQGESDYHWVIERASFGADDPPVFGFGLDYETMKFVAETGERCNSPYGSFGRVTDWLREYFDSYVEGVGYAFERLRKEAADRIPLTYGLPVKGFLWTAPFPPRGSPGTGSVRRQFDEKSAAETRTYLMDAVMAALDNYDVEESTSWPVGDADEAADILRMLEDDFGFTFADGFEPTTVAQIFDEALKQGADEQL